VAAAVDQPIEEHRIVYERLDHLRPHPDNPKGHDIPLIRASMRRHGYAATIMVCDRTGLIAAGHGRRAALLAERGQTPDSPPRFVRLDDDGNWLVPVQHGWSSTDDAELLAYVLADNETSKAAGWIPDLLGPALQVVFATPLQLEGTGFTPAMMAELGAVMGPHDLPEAPAANAYREQYGVIVVCAGEDEQRVLYERLTGEGLECRVVVT
jgi:hypothetical protein